MTRNATIINEPLSEKREVNARNAPADLGRDLLNILSQFSRYQTNILPQD